MKNIQKILAMSIVTLFLISSPIGIISNGGSTTFDDDIKFIILPPIPAISPESCYLGNFEKGDKASTSFQIWNGVIDPDPYDNIFYDDLYWKIVIPEIYQNYVKVSKLNGVSKVPFYDKINDYYIFDKEKITLFLDTTDILIGDYEINIIIDCIRPDMTIDNNKDGIFTVKFSVGPYLKLSYDGKQYSRNQGKEYLYLGKPQTEILEFKIWNGGYGMLHYNMNYSCYKNRIVPGVVENPSGGWDDIIARDPFRNDWIIISPLFGESTGTNDIDTISVTVNTSTLEERKNPQSFSETGEYQCNIWIYSDAVNYGGKALISIVVRVGPQIAYGQDGDSSNNKVDLGNLFRGDINSTTFQIWNKVPGNLTWNISISPELSDYMDVYPKKGISKGPWDITNVTVTIDTNKKFSNVSYVFRPRDGLIFKSNDLSAPRPGRHEDRIMIMSNDIHAINRCMIP